MAPRILKKYLDDFYYLKSENAWLSGGGWLSGGWKTSFWIRFTVNRNISFLAKVSPMQKRFP